MTTKEGGLRGSIRNVGVAVSAIPDSALLQTAIHYWPMGEGSSTTFADGESNADGTLQNNSTWDNAAETWVQDFGTEYPNTADYGVVDANRTDPGNTGGLALTFHATAFPATDNDYNYAFCHPGTSNNNRLYVIASNSNGELQLTVGDNSTIITTDISTNTTYRLGLAWDADADEVEGYLNGSSIGTASVGNSSLNLTAENWYFGDFDGTDSFGYEGYIDFPILSNERPSDADFQDDYNSQPWVASDTTAVFSDNHAHQMFPTVSPPAVQYQGTTFIVGQEYDATNDVSRHRVRAYDESDGSWTTVTEVDTTDLDLHEPGALVRDGSDILHLIYGSHHSDDTTTYQAETDQPLDISSWDTTAQNFGDDYAYRQAFATGQTIRVFTRKITNSTTRSLEHRASTDAGSSWNSDTLIELSDDWIYPVNASETASDYHELVCGVRDGLGGDMLVVLQFAYDATNNEIVGPDGSTVAPPVTSLSTLDSIGAVVADTDAVHGAGLGFDGGNPLVAYVREQSGATDIEFASWNGSAWDVTTVFSGTPSDSFFDGETLRLVVNGSDDYRLLETLWCKNGSDNAIGAFDTSDGGSTWSSRTQVKELTETTNGVRFINPVRNAGEIKWVGSEETNPGTVESGGARVLAFDSNWNIIGP